MEEAKRFDNDKIRLDLIPPTLMEEVGKIMSMGAKKYGDNNWKKGMKWSRCIASLKRHLLAFEKGVDKDDESHEYHLSHVIVNAMFLLQYYKDHPELDDRPHHYLQPKKIGLDIDEVLSDFVGAYCKRYNVPTANFWTFDVDMFKKFEELSKDKDFWVNLPVKTKAEDLPFEPWCFITSRSIPYQWTQEWLQKNGFPAVPLYCVPFNTSKLEVVKQSGIDIFVDDRWDTFVELNKNGILCYLYDAQHNQKYQVGYKRIKSLKELE